MSKTGPRSNFSLLEFPVRFKLIRLLHDGATCEAIAADPEIAAAYAARGLKLTRSALSRIKQCREYKDITAQRLKAAQSHEADRLITAFLKENGALETIAEQTKVALLKLVRECVKANPDDTKEVERLVRSVVNLSNPAKDNQIAELKRKLEDFRQRFDGAEKEWQAREAELEVLLAEKDQRIAELEKLIPGVDSGKVADAMDQKFGV